LVLVLMVLCLKVSAAYFHRSSVTIADEAWQNGSRFLVHFFFSFQEKLGHLIMKHTSTYSLQMLRLAVVLIYVVLNLVQITVFMASSRLGVLTCLK
jgi:hypothetical protein